ncbi:MAG: iron ABC transporter permease [Chitinispirillaceae bacterium]|nr:iron ABC transporter permease [Chitinispirillaceae bacterium]
MTHLNRLFAVVSGLAVVSLAALIICPMIGIVTIVPREMIHDENLRYVFLSMRLPRVLAAFCAGGGLAVAGMVYQAIFRNPLADPYTLGVSSGASLGAALCILAGVSGSVSGMSIITAGAFAGALASIAVIYCFAWLREANSSTLLLAGVIVATLCSGLIMFIHFIGGLHKSFHILRWIMGGVDGVSYSLMVFMLIPLAAFIAVTSMLMPQLDQFLTGDSIAHSRGVNVRASRNVFISITAVAVGGIVAVCGPIGFIGIIAPHACRLLMPGVRHRLLALCSFLLGGTFLIVADTLARTLVPPSEIPVGIITALLGGPCFLLLLFRRKSRLLV